MELRKRRITDPEALKALAHPVRMALLDALATAGQLTASQAADLVGESPSNCSWHLRKLAEHGFVEEATGGTGRNRPWRAVVESHEWDDETADPAARVAGHALTDALLQRELQRLRAAGGRDESPEWRHATTVSQSQLWLTAEEAHDLGEQMRNLFLTHVERHHDASRRPEGARLVSLVGWLVPSGSPRVDFEAAVPDDDQDDAATGGEEGDKA